MKKHLPFFTLILLLSVSQTMAQLNTETGPVFENFGPVYHVPDANFRTDKQGPMKVVFDVNRKLRDSSRVNPSIETAARYLNLHLKNGFDNANVKVAMVVHGRAVKDLQTSEAYQKEFGINNPNEPLVKALLDAGVELVLCGQSSAYHGVSLSSSVPGFKWIFLP